LRAAGRPPVSVCVRGDGASVSAVGGISICHHFVLTYALIPPSGSCRRVRCTLRLRKMTLRGFCRSALNWKLPISRPPPLPTALGNRQRAAISHISTARLLRTFQLCGNKQCCRRSLGMSHLCPIEMSDCPLSSIVAWEADDFGMGDDQRARAEADRNVE
jgi:hypothetical protein